MPATLPVWATVGMGIWLPVKERKLAYSYLSPKEIFENKVNFFNIVHDFEIPWF